MPLIARNTYWRLRYLAIFTTICRLRPSILAPVRWILSVKLISIGGVMFITPLKSQNTGSPISLNFRSKFCWEYYLSESHFQCTVFFSALALFSSLILWIFAEDHSECSCKIGVLSAFIDQLKIGRSLATSPAPLKARSDATDVAGTQRCFSARIATRVGYTVWLSLHHFSTSIDFSSTECKLERQLELYVNSAGFSISSLWLSGAVKKSDNFRFFSGSHHHVCNISCFVRLFWLYYRYFWHLCKYIMLVVWVVVLEPQPSSAACPSAYVGEMMLAKQDAVAVGGEPSGETHLPHLARTLSTQFLAIQHSFGENLSAFTVQNSNVLDYYWVPVCHFLR